MSTPDLDYSIQYEKWHDDSDEHYDRSASFYRRLLAPVLRELPTGSRVLDVGCGTGLLINTLIGMGFVAARGIDISAQQIARARARGLPCDQIAVDGLARRAEAEPGSLDVIFLLDVLEHVPVAGQIEFVRHLARLLVPGGRLVISVPNASASFAPRWVWNDWEHVCAFSEHSLDFVLRNAGFDAPAYLPYEFGDALVFPYLHQSAFWTRALRRIFRGLRRLEAIAEFGRQGLAIPLGLNLLAVARKPG